jgi:hypothetical protein
MVICYNLWRRRFATTCGGGILLQPGMGGDNNLLRSATMAAVCCYRRQRLRFAATCGGGDGDLLQPGMGGDDDLLQPATAAAVCCKRGGGDGGLLQVAAAICCGRR